MVELKQQSIKPLAIYLKTLGLAQCNGISFIDSTPFRVVIIEEFINIKRLKI